MNAVLTDLTDIDDAIARIALFRTRFECAPTVASRKVRQYPYQYFIDLGSMFDDRSIETMIAILESTIVWFRTNNKGRWGWLPRDEFIWRQQDSGQPLFVDVRKYLYISFDLKDDAMLSRLTLQNLKGIQRADCRRVSREA